MLATTMGIVVFIIIFTGVIVLGEVILYFENIYTNQVYAFYAAYAVKYFMLLLDIALLVTFYGTEFLNVRQEILNNKVD